jgi:PAS domain S-box-containing protein
MSGRERTAAAGALAGNAESEARLRALADNLPHAMVYQIAADADGARRRFTFVGGSCERLNGVPADAVLADADQLYRLIAPEDRERLAAAEAAAFEARTGFDLEVGFVLPDGRRRWCRLSSAPRTLADGSMLWDGVQLDITESRRAAEQLATERERLALVVEATGLGLWDFDPATGSLAWDERVRAVYGVASDAPVTYETYRSYVHPEDRDAVGAVYAAAMEGGGAGFRTEHRTLGPDGVVRWILGCGRILRDARGRPVRVIGSTLDITERKQFEERLQLLVHELNHRVKNSMAVVQAIVRRTLRTSATAEAADERLTARLMALARAHDLLTDENWAGAALDEVVARALTALGVEPHRFAAAGPPLRLRPNAAVTLALVMHELGTNAVKYGALSGDAGRVEVAWDCDEGRDRMRLSWRERGGPAVEPPKQRGVGGQRLERGRAPEVGGAVRVTYAPEGLACVIEGPLSRLRPG